MMLENKQSPDALVSGAQDSRTSTMKSSQKGADGVLTATSFSSHALRELDTCPRRPSAVSSNGAPPGSKMDTPDHVARKWIIKSGQWVLTGGEKPRSLQEQMKAYRVMLERMSKEKRYANGVAQGGMMRRWLQRNDAGGFWALGSGPARIS